MHSASWRIVVGFILSVAFGPVAIIGCGGSSTPAVPTVAISPSAAQSIDAGQSVALTAGVTNDQNSAGVSWTLSGSGTLSSSSTTGTTYTAPSSVSSAATVTVTATSVFNGAVSATHSITINPTLAVSSSSLSACTVGAAYSATLAATGGSGSLTWTLASGTLPTGITLSSAGVLSGTVTAAGSNVITVKVTDSSSATAQSATSGNLTLACSLATATPTLTSLSSTLTGEVNLPFSATVTATGGTTPYTFAISAGTLPAGLSISSTTGAITGTPTAVTASTAVTVKVTDAHSVSATQADTITINAARGNSLNAELNGQYAFLVSGFDVAGSPAASAGSFTANGSGSITTGVFDLNDTALASANTNVTITGGSYGIGADNRGQLTLTSSSGSVIYVIAADKISSGIAVSGYMMRFDATGNTVTGRFQLQSSSAFSTAAISGGYAFGVSGFAKGSSASSQVHSGTIGQIQLSNGNVSSGEFIASSSGSATPITINSGATSVYAVNSSTGSANGRGTLSFTFTSGSSTKTVNWIFYIIDATKMYMISADSSASAGTNAQDLLSGQAAAQAGTYNAASLNGNFVFHATGLVTTTSGSVSTYASQGELGVLTFNGTTGVSTSFDTNSGGTSDSVTSGGTGPWNAATSSTTYTVASNGRVALAGTTAPSFYLAGPVITVAGTSGPSGFSLDLSGQINTGGMEPQTATSFSLASVTGAYSGGNIDPAAQNTAYTTLSITSNGAGAFTAAASDQNQLGFLAPDVSFAGATYTYTASSSGRYVVATSGTGAPTILYVAGSNKAYIISLSSGNPVLIELTHQ